MMEHEIQPWLVLVDDQVAFWQLSEPPAAALALFSDEVQASAYVRGLNTANCQVRQPTRRELLALMISCYQQQVLYAVLDPNAQTARRIFQLRDVLKAAQTEFGVR